MGHRYCRPIPCYHGYGSLPPARRPCCRFQPSMLICTREIRSKLGPRHNVKRYHRSQPS